MKRGMTALAGMLIFALGINLFLVPAGLYNGGILGISQVIRSLLLRYTDLSFGNRDIAGLINLMLNLPLFVLAYFKIGKKFVGKTMLCVAGQTLFLSLIPIPQESLVDALTGSITGGILAGMGVGIALRAGGSSGGMDILGMYFTKQFKGFSVGKVSLGVNIVIYSICAFLFGVQTAIYSIIYSAVATLVTDKTHTQNINTEILIFTKEKPDKIIRCLIDEYQRDATYWEAKGGYTGGMTYMVITILSKYECVNFRRDLKNLDEHAFLVEKDGLFIGGLHEKHL